MLTTDKSFYRSIFKIALPLLFGNLVNYLITLTDNLFTGKLGDINAGAAFLGMQISSVFVMLVSGIEAGVMLGAVQSRGKGNENEARTAALIGAGISVTLGLALTALSRGCPKLLMAPFLKGENIEVAANYLRTLSVSFIPSALCASLGAYLKAFENPGASLVGSLGALCVNFILGKALVLGGFGINPIGVLGSAVAFSFAKIAEALILSVFAFIRLRKNDKKPLFRKLSFPLIGNFLSYTAPLVLAQIVWITNTLFASFTIGQLNAGPEMCAFSMANAIGAATYILPNALSVSLGIFISKSVGAGKGNLLKPYTYTAELIFIIIGALTSLALLIFKEPFVALYEVSPEAKSLAKKLISVYAVSAPATAYSNALLSAVVRSGGDVGFILKTDSFFIFAVLIPLTLILTYIGAPIPIIFLALKSDQILKCIPAAIKINRFGWAKRVTEK